MEMLREESKKDVILKILTETIGRHNRCHSAKVPRVYKDVFPELWMVNGVLLRGKQIVIPKVLQADVISLAHEGHQCAENTLQLLRQSVWFPGMNTCVKYYVGSCPGCNCALSYNPPVPFKPNVLPDRPWQKLHCDFKGPIAQKYYLHIIIDQYSKYPEVDVVSSTSFSKLRPALDRVFATHGVPETMSVDNGSPYFGHEMKLYAKEIGFRLTPVTPDDPQSNGFVENFVKTLCKLIHASLAEGKDVRSELYTFLMQYRATPHWTTGKSPAEMLFNRRIHTKLPQVFPSEETEGQKEIRRHHDAKKMKQKVHFDRCNKVREKDLSVGDQAILKQNKSTTQERDQRKSSNS